jgi:hypothetical protein
MVDNGLQDYYIPENRLVAQLSSEVIGYSPSSVGSIISAIGDKDSGQGWPPI